MSKLAYTMQEAADEIGASCQTVLAAVHAGDLVARYVGEKVVIPHYDLELWVLGQPEYLIGLSERQAKLRAEDDARQAERVAKSELRRANKEARDAERARLQSDLDELERLRGLASAHRFEQVAA